MGNTCRRVRCIPERVTQEYTTAIDVANGVDDGQPRRLCATDVAGIGECSRVRGMCSAACEWKA